MLDDSGPVWDMSNDAEYTYIGEGLHPSCHKLLVLSDWEGLGPVGISHWGWAWYAYFTNGVASGRAGSSASAREAALARGRRALAPVGALSISYSCGSLSLTDEPSVLNLNPA